MIKAFLTGVAYTAYGVILCLIGLTLLALPVHIGILCLGKKAGLFLGSMIGLCLAGGYGSVLMEKYPI